MPTTIHPPAPERKEHTLSDETLAMLSWAGGIPILFVMCIIVAIFGGRELIVGVCAGGCAIILIHAGIYRSLKNVLSGSAGGSQKSGVFVVSGFFLRLLVAGVILAGLLSRGWAHPLGVALGASVIVINNVLLAAMLATRKNHTEVGSV